MCIACDLSTALGDLLHANAQAAGKAASPFVADRRAFVRGALACVAVPLASATFRSRRAEAAPADRTADVVFRNGAVYTLSPQRPWAQAVAVAGQKIVAVGSDGDMDPFVGAGTEIIDLKGRMLLPGFVEGHIHPLLGSFFTAGVDLQYPTRAEALQALRQHATENPTGVLRGFGWRMDMFGPNGPIRQDIDAVVPDRPVLLFSIDCHSLWCNSKALEVAGITKDTADPIPGFSYYARDPDGHATGFVLEVLALLQIVNAVEPVTVAGMTRLLGEWLPKAAAAGITTVFDAGVPPIGKNIGDIVQIYRDYEDKGALPFRVVACHAIKGPPIEDAIPATLRLAERFRSPLVDARILKIVGDGSHGGWTAYLLEDYADKPGFRGTPPFDQGQLDQMIRAAEAAGVDVHVHACGDGTAEMALDAFEAASAGHPARDRRNTIAHNVSVSDRDIARFAKLGVVAEFSLNWHCLDPDTGTTMLARCGPERQAKLYRVRSVLRAGGRISAGTDWPAAGYHSTYRPLDSIQVGVTRRQLGASDDDIGLAPAEERLDLSEAIAANTLGAAYQLRLDHTIGSIEVGKSADLVVLDRNLFDISTSDIAKTSVRMTMMNGRFTHRTG